MKSTKKKRFTTLLFSWLRFVCLLFVGLGCLFFGTVFCFVLYCLFTLFVLFAVFVVRACFFLRILFICSFICARFVCHHGLTDSHSRGLFAGLSLEGGIIVARADVNRKFYGREVSVRWVGGWVGGCMGGFPSCRRRCCCRPHRLQGGAANGVPRRGSRTNAILHFSALSLCCCCCYCCDSRYRHTQSVLEPKASKRTRFCM